MDQLSFQVAEAYMKQQEADEEQQQVTKKIEATQPKQPFLSMPGIQGDVYEANTDFF